VFISSEYLFFEDSVIIFRFFIFLFEILFILIQLFINKLYMLIYINIIC
jgi:hypothetical protein